MKTTYHNNFRTRGIIGFRWGLRGYLNLIKEYRRWPELFGKYPSW